MTNFEQHTADLIVSTIDATGRALADATRAEMTLEDERAAAKMAAIGRIMSSGDNSLTGKPHSFSSAEAVVNTDPEYQAYLAKMRDATHARLVARSHYDAACAAARLAAGVSTHV